MSNEKEKKAMLDLLDRFERSIARADVILSIAGAAGQVTEELEDFLELDGPEGLEKAFGVKMPKLVKKAIDEKEYHEFFSWLENKCLLGFLVKFSTPVQREKFFSWNCWTSGWVYGATLDEAMERGFEWVALQREKEAATKEETR